MLFNSIQFLIFFPIVTLLYFLIPHKVRYIWLLVCSYYFYMCWNPTYALLILTSTILTYGCGLGMELVSGKVTEEKKQVWLKRTCLLVCFAANLGILGYFKYSNFFLQTWAKVVGKTEVNHVDVLLPVGISFYTFQALGYAADVYRKEIHAEKNFLKYALFVSFFPQLVAGPIERSGSLLKQFEEKHHFSFERTLDGLACMLWGYFLKVVVADRIAVFVDAVYGDLERYGGWYVVIAAILFLFQIYCDFAGYSTIALGAAGILGFELTDNFLAPFFSKTVSEFWKRWHVSLNLWFKDYIYIPLGGSKKGKARKYLNILVVFAISGLWHGAAWSFVAWGLINAVAQIVGELLQPVRDLLVKGLSLNRESFSHKLYRVITTFSLVAFSFIFFRTGSLKVGVEAVKSIFQVKNAWILFDDSLFNLGLDWKNFLIMICSMLIILVADFCKYHGVVIRECIAKQELWFRITVYLAAVLGILVFGIWGSGYDAATFIYFQF